MRGFSALLLVSILGTVAAVAQNASLEELNQRLLKHYDSVHKNSRDQDDRCSLHRVYEAKAAFFEDRFHKQLHGNPSVYVHSPCIGPDSLGNFIGNYFENVNCANRSRLHYMAVAKGWDPKDLHYTSPFLRAIPMLIPHKNPVTTHNEGVALLKSKCPCRHTCHEKKESLWYQNLTQIYDVVTTALHEQVRQDTEGLFRHTNVTVSDLSNVQAGTILPFVPDVAIHYRCGDNFFGHYGFVPFSAFPKLVPADAKTIYVLSEPRGRKTAGKRLEMARKCNVILPALFNFLVDKFPNATIVLRRGDDIFADFARLSYANTLICSVSTFCLWPAIISNGTNAHYPKTQLIVDGDTSIQLGDRFHWFDKPAVVRGKRFTNNPPSVLLKALHHNT